MIFLAGFASSLLVLLALSSLLSLLSLPEGDHLAPLPAGRVEVFFLYDDLPS